MAKFFLYTSAKLPEKLWDDAKDGFFTDCSIRVEGKVLNAHRVILSSGSQYLRHFFLNHKKTVRFNIPSVSFQSIESVFKLIYCGSVNVEPNKVKEYAALIDILEIDAGKVDGNGQDEWISEPSQHNMEEVSFTQDLSGILNSTKVVDAELSLAPTDLTDDEDDEGLPEDQLSTEQSASVNCRTTCVHFFPVRKSKNEYWMRKKRQSIGLLPFSCRFCPYQRFATTRGRKNHELTCSFNLDSREFFKCDKCGKHYLFKASLNRHMERNHINEL